MIASCTLGSAASCAILSIAWSASSGASRLAISALISSRGVRCDLATLAPPSPEAASCAKRFGCVCAARCRSNSSRMPCSVGSFQLHGSTYRRARYFPMLVVWPSCSAELYARNSAISPSKYLEPLASMPKSEYVMLARPSSSTTNSASGFPLLHPSTNSRTSLPRLMTVTMWKLVGSIPSVFSEYFPNWTFHLGSNEFATPALCSMTTWTW
mmetsp:Transcript_21975/g.51928  ORF Transcript_21975/g.51928 Transcript_21975/m.51928 type:complete len:212 (+) Transcript_21975:196-831(+)